jgi:hypothetical protein
MTARPRWRTVKTLPRGFRVLGRAVLPAELTGLLSTAA